MTGSVNFFCFADSITLLKKLIRKKVSHLTCILIKGTFPSTNQHPCIFSCFKRPSTHMQDALENVFAQREITFTHRLTLEESNSCPSRPTVSPSKLSLKKNKVEKVSGTGWHLKICKQCTADYEMKGLLRPLRNHRLHLRRSPSSRVTTTVRILTTVVKYFEENILC